MRQGHVIAFQVEHDHQNNRSAAGLSFFSLTEIITCHGRAKGKAYIGLVFVLNWLLYLYF